MRSGKPSGEVACVAPNCRAHAPEDRLIAQLEVGGRRLHHALMAFERAL